MVANSPDYWWEASNALAASDAVMARLVACHTDAALASRGDSVWARFAGRLEVVTPGMVLALGSEGLRGCGLSQRKIEYLCDLAAHFDDGRLDPAGWAQLDDAALITELCRVRGIGRWTAEMFLIFNLMRPDVFPLDDIGLQRAVGTHYLAGEKPSRQVLADFGERWRPWRSVATWYLWRSLDPVPVAY